MTACSKCKGSGLLPFIGKNGKARHDVLVDCDCKETPVEQYYPLTSADFDSACSDSWRGYYHERYDGSDPARVQPHPPEPKSDVFKPRPVSYDLEQLKLHLLHVEKKLFEHTVLRKPKESGYKGIK